MNEHFLHESDLKVRFENGFFLIYALYLPEIKPKGYGFETDDLKIDCIIFEKVSIDKCNTRRKALEIAMSMPFLKHHIGKFSDRKLYRFAANKILEKSKSIHRSTYSNSQSDGYMSSPYVQFGSSAWIASSLID